VRIETLNCLAFGLLLAACEGANPSPAGGSPAASAPAAPVAGPAVKAPAASVTGANTAGLTLAQVREDVPLPLTKLLGRPIAEVQAELGEPLDKGMMRKSCFRFAPARTHFTCRYALRTYADRTGNFKSVRVAYEDGVATAAAYDGWLHGSGAFTPEALLTAVGLTLPTSGKLQEPGPGVRLWTWFNGQARLMIAGKQHRVEVSIVDDDWSRSRLEVVMNHPLTPEQQALLVMVDGKAVNEAAPVEPAPAGSLMMSPTSHP
jgi:hypothetical protein